MPALPKGWKARCAQVLARDGNRCRYCEWATSLLHVDHILPRRLADAEWRDSLDNLCVLCDSHHGDKTAHVEVELFRGDPWRFWLWLEVLRRTGPTPTMRQIGAALKTLRTQLEQIP